MKKVSYQQYGGVNELEEAYTAIPKGGIVGKAVFTVGD
ncbi:hypothetical protein Niako_0599 [Niastella koreensis GR20-10]|uniref:Uncharacterized protein n=1 Tax=Niastella koreensis (strain DSM 17620 / KACC 11465 / NBRC 106392 / GR20-10) TaxID=700598 RepID=G8T935_NIAKG|nr:hypothetical protein Niako_0599 [Niastella koreensis GR20-10]